MHPSLPKLGYLDLGGSVALGTPGLAEIAAQSWGGVRGHLGVLRPTLRLVKGVKVPRHRSLPKLRSLQACGSVARGMPDLSEAAVLSGGGVRGNPGFRGPLGAS